MTETYLRWAAEDKAERENTEAKLEKLGKIRDVLTNRERDVFDGLAKGQSLAQIAKDCGISAKRVGELRDQIKNKFLRANPPERTIAELGPRSRIEGGR